MRGRTRSLTLVAILVIFSVVLVSTLNTQSDTVEADTVETEGLFFVDCPKPGSSQQYRPLECHLLQTHRL